MTRYSKNSSAKKANISQETQDEALKIAKGIQKPGQDKAQTKLIAQGIQKGIVQYKKQHKARSRDLNKQRKNLVKDQEDIAPAAITPAKQHWLKYGLPWFLLIASWAFFAVYLNGAFSLLKE